MATQNLRVNIGWFAPGAILKDLYNRSVACFWADVKSDELGAGSPQRESYVADTEGEASGSNILSSNNVASEVLDTEQRLRLTEECESELKKVLRCEKKISTYEAMIRFIETEIIEIQDTCNSVNEQLQTGDFDDRAERLEVLDVGRIMIGDRRAQHSELTQKLIHATQERSLPGTLFWLNLEETLVRYNLIDETHIEESLQAFVDHDENPAPSPNQEDPELYQENQEFSDQSELQADQVMEEETRRLSASTDLEMAVDEVPDVGARQNAWERLHLAQGGYDEAREKFDDWPQYYHHQYVGYQAGYDRGAISTTKTEFDNILFIRERQAGLELIEAEKQLQEARKDIKSLGLDPESGFVESFYDEDEAALEFDPDCVDRSKIEKWLSGNPPHDSIDDEMWLPHPEKQGDWADDACSLAFGESVSVVAEGPERVEIDEWKVECARVYRESQRIYRESLTA